MGTIVCLCAMKINSAANSNVNVALAVIGVLSEICEPYNVDIWVYVHATPIIYANCSALSTSSNAWCLYTGAFFHHFTWEL